MTAKVVSTILLAVSLIACGSSSNSQTASPLIQSANPVANVGLVEAFPALEFRNSIYLTAVPGSSRLAVIEQAGKLRVFENSDDVTATVTVLDLSDRLLSGGEQGLLGLAFDPDFTLNGYVYINYSMNNPRRNVISRMQWDTSEDRILPETEKIILEIEQPFSNHNGGMLAFGPDGFLYIGVGDGGSGGDPRGHGQDRTTLLGNLLRLDVHTDAVDAPYVIPASNPFVNDPCCLPEIYAYGFRNPYRFSFDRASGALWVPDVGQNAIEEINVVEAGGNYGWNVYEGTLEFSDAKGVSTLNHKPPVFEYDHSQGSSITGGYVYRGESIPSMQGMYLYADYVSNSVWALAIDADGNTRNTRLGAVRNPVSFGESADGELFIVTHNNGIVSIR